MGLVATLTAYAGVAALFVAATVYVSRRLALGPTADEPPTE